MPNNTTPITATNDLINADLGPITRSNPPSAQHSAQDNFRVITVHKARLQDALSIFDLVNSLSSDGTLLRRSYAEICENIRDFTVACIPNPEGEHEFIGCGALHLYGPHLA